VGVFSKNPLGILDNLYRFVGGQKGPNSFAEEMEIQPVHDVSREAEMGSAQSAALGYFLEGFTQVHVGTGALFATADPYARTFKDLDPFDVDIWFMDALMNLDDSGDFQDGGIGISYPVLPGTFPSALVKTVFEYTTPGSTLTSGGVNPVPPVARLVTLPMYDPHGSQLLVRTVADGSGTVTITTFGLFWAGARSALPPGLA